ncbi:DUF1016 N-terminal domain-containing protein [Methylovulum psychrotolerans]|uniref:YhcG N-terminal domain-containing protein n=1 Tax=Methylovulum psychrotolerans TaxID=1704499 RepID=A0A1Z4C4T9_9GAMM|nr:DUF1016 N-terminal domain-containing protein [Methylovulum psychrotolerans]ASF48552.1 hypothetical protein CEK71_22215 [Methylovulum psychrotolerans]
MPLATASYTELLGNITDKLHQGHEKAEYGSGLLDRPSKELSAQHGKGFSRSNIFYMRKFYSCFPNRETLSHKLTWSHYFEILKADKLHLPDKETLMARLNVLLAQDRDDEVQE